MCFARKLATLTIKLQNIDHQSSLSHVIYCLSLHCTADPKMGKAQKRLLKDLAISKINAQGANMQVNAQEAQERLRWADSLGVDCR